jgi:glutathione S-transferase
MKLYGFTRSPFSRKVRIVLSEKRIPYDWIEYQDRHKDPRYTIMNPYKTVPILELDSGTCLYESTVINEYLEDAYPEPALLPRDIEGRAIARLWEDFADAHLFVALSAVLRDKFEFTREGIKPRDPATVDAASAREHRAAFEEELNRLEKRLEGRDYVAGQGRGVFTLVDVALAPFLLGSASRLEFSISENRPNLISWIERVRARPSGREIVQGDPIRNSSWFFFRIGDRRFDSLQPRM